MFSVLLKSLSFVLIILLGYVLKRRVFTTEGDYRFPAFLLLNITLPATVIHAFGAFKGNQSLLALVGYGFLAALIPMLLVWLLGFRLPRERRAFGMINVTGFNIGAFTLPFVQSFFGPAGVIAACLFDIGNALLVAGGSYALTSSVLGTDDEERFSLFTMVKRLFSSMPFNTYLLMLLLVVFDLSIPTPVLTVLEPFARANAFVAMFMIGMMCEFRLSGGRFWSLAWVIGLRLAVGALCSWLMFCFAPFSLEVRQTLAVVAFAPVSSLAPIFSERLRADGGLSSLTLSVSVPFSLTAIVGLVLWMQG